MRAVRAQFFLTYAVSGCLLPYIPVYFGQRGLNETQIGYVMAAASVAVVLSPVLVTLLADTRIDARRLMACTMGLAGLVLLLFPLSAGFWFVLLLWSVHTLTYVPIVPLQDGINFSIQERRRLAGEPVEPYHKVRVWGTIGFIVPSLVLFFLLRYGFGVGSTLVAGFICAIIAGLNALSLPDPRIRFRPDPTSAMPPGARIPTFAAARALLRPPLLAFCLASFLLGAAGAAYGTFYPVYLKDVIGVDDQWLGPVANLGVTVEVFFMLLFGWLVRHWGMRRLMLVGVLSVATRMALLAAAPNVYVAVGTQAFHGLTVLVMGVIPPVYINHYAEDRWRHSIQGLYTMFVVGGARIAGNLSAGPIARWSLTGVFAYATILCALAAILVLLAFHEEQHRPRPGDIGSRAGSQRGG